MQLYTYQYVIRNITITLDKNYVLSDGAVTYWSIIHDYESRKMPIFRIQFEVQRDLLAKLYQYASGSGRIKFDIQEYQYNGDGKVVGTRMYMSHVWSYIPETDSSEKLTSNDVTTAAISDEMTDPQIFGCYLIDTDAINWFNKQLSMNFRSASRPAILHALLESRDVPSNSVIATPPMNYGILTNAVFPYGDLIGNISYMNSRYGIYDSEPLVYYDGNYLYCVNRLNPNIKVRQVNNYNDVIFTLYNPTSPNRQSEGSCDDSVDKAHYMNLANDPIITDYSQRKEDAKFDTVTTISKNGSVSKQNLTQSASGASTAMVYTYAYNELSEDQIINDNLAKGRTVTVSVNNASLFPLVPYKRFGFSPDSQYTDLNLQGKAFRLKGWTVTVSREGAGSQASYLHNVMISLFEQMRS